jgi:hypothetical protein
MRRTALFLMAAATLGGCALPAENLKRDGLAWALNQDSQAARLTLGAPNSDDIRLTMSCVPHQGAVDVTVAGRPDDSAGVEFHSGTTWNRYTGAGHADEETSGQVDIGFKLSAADPVLRSFADTGDLTVVFVLRKVVLPNAFAPAHDFVNLCRLP